MSGILAALFYFFGKPVNRRRLLQLWGTFCCNYIFQRKNWPKTKHQSKEQQNRENLTTNGYTKGTHQPKEHRSRRTPKNHGLKQTSCSLARTHARTHFAMPRKTKTTIKRGREWWTRWALYQLEGYTHPAFDRVGSSSQDPRDLERKQKVAL